MPKVGDEGEDVPTLYFNELEPFNVRWLGRLFPQARVDGRSVLRVVPADLDNFQRVHLFAGIGGWEYALQLARWPQERQVWTGSCPCQPFSRSGKRRQRFDSRDLWPEMLRLIRQCKPPTVFGEQVAGPEGVDWLTRVRADLEKEDYAVGAADLCAAGLGAPHIRQRLYWVAQLVQPKGERPHERPEVVGLRSGEDTHQIRQTMGDQPRQSGIPDPWRRCRTVRCKDGNRRISPEPGAYPLAHGVPGRVGQIRAYGNAIVPQLAAVFIQAFLETEKEIKLQ